MTSPLDLLHELAGRDGISVSIYLPTHRAGPGIEQDPIRFRHLVETARQRLGERLPTREVDRLLEPVLELLDDGAFWQARTEGLAVFLPHGGATIESLPYAPNEAATVGDQYQLTPLLRLVQADDRFWVLALSQNQVRLLDCGLDGPTAADLGATPTSRAEALAYEDHERQLQSHTSEPTGRAAIFHGHGMGGERHKGELDRFVRRVERGVDEIVAATPAPLVLACVERDAAAYRSVNRRRDIVPESVSGNPDHLTDRELADRARPLVQEHRAAVRREIAARFGEQRGRGVTAEGLDEVLPAAESGRVHELLVADGGQVWGDFDPGSGTVVGHEPRRGDDVELVNLAVVQTVRRGGSVRVLPAEDLPTPAPVIAALRYRS